LGTTAAQVQGTSVETTDSAATDDGSWVYEDENKKASDATTTDTTTTDATPAEKPADESTTK